MSVLSDLIFLWQNREIPKSGVRRFKVWAKRGYHAIGIIRLFLRAVKYRARGAMIGRLVILGQLDAGGRLNNLAVGDESTIGKCTIALHDRVCIGRRVVINDGCKILTGSHSLSDPRWGLKKAPVFIDDYCWIATDALILPGVRIGRGSVVGAGAVVRDDIPDYGIVIGNPGKLLPVRRTGDLSYNPVTLCAPIEAWVGPQKLR